MCQRVSTAARHFFLTRHFYTIYAILRDFCAILRDFLPGTNFLLPGTSNYSAPLVTRPGTFIGIRIP